MTAVDEYIQQVIQQGDEGSKLLAKICAPTLRNSPSIDILQEGMNGIAVARIPKDKIVVAHAACGDPRETNIVTHAESLVDCLVEQAKKIGATPIAFANVVDSSTGETSLLESIGNSLAARANAHHVAIVNGENAILGPRITREANVSGMMISLVEKDIRALGLVRKHGSLYAFFDPEGKPVYLNSDGVGTKTEFYERNGKHFHALHDSLAMKLDDLVKLGATAKVVADVVEHAGDISIRDLFIEAERLGKQFDFFYLLEPKHVGERLRGYKPGAPVFNISGSAVSTIDEERLKHPLRPSTGEYLVALAGQPNPRSSGITAKRSIMEANFGTEWHTTSIGKHFLSYLAIPSIMFYGLFLELINQGKATSVYHLSGGAYHGKLARPLAKHNLFARLENLFQPDSRELEIMRLGNISTEAAYAAWPMGNDGFITTTDTESALEIIARHNLMGRIVGQLETAQAGKTGVEIRTSTGERIYFSGTA